MRNRNIEKLLRLAYTDAMTGVYNRSAYEEKLKHIRRDRAKTDDITVMVAGLNGLKGINNRFGRHTGDEALKIVADALLKTVGKNGKVYRTGSTEFVCIATGKTLGRISEFRDLVAFEDAMHTYDFSVSIGYAAHAYNFNGDIDIMIKHCDRLMHADRWRSN